MQIVYLIKWFMPQIYKELIQLNSKNKQITQLEIGRGTERFFFFQGQHTGGQQVHAQVLSISDRQEDVEQGHNELLSHLLGGPSSKRPETGVEKRETCVLSTGM